MSEKDAVMAKEKKQARNPNTHWVWREEPPLFYEPVSDHPIEVKLANMKAAIADGADVNELDHEPGPRHYGRPLHYTMDPGIVNYKVMKDHLPLVKLLLEHGADPRLTGRKPDTWPGTPMDEARNGLGFDLRHDPDWAVVVPFYKEALDLMKQVADRLDAQDAAKEAAKERDNDKQEHSSKGGSFISRFRLW